MSHSGSAHHLLRVRISKRMMEEMSEAARRLSSSIGQRVTVSDLVRAACNRHMKLLNALERYQAAVENTPEGDLVDLDYQPFDHRGRK